MLCNLLGGGNRLWWLCPSSEHRRAAGSQTHYQLRSESVDWSDPMNHNVESWSLASLTSTFYWWQFEFLCWETPRWKHSQNEMNSYTDHQINLAASRFHFEQEMCCWLTCLSRWCFVLLAAIVLNEVDDVRSVLEFYSQFDDPLEAFRAKQRQLQVLHHFSILHLCCLTSTVTECQ